MLFKKYLSAISFLALISAVGCANSPQKVTPAQQQRMSAVEEADSLSVTNAAAVKAQASDFVEIKFNKGSALLTENAKSSLNLIIQQAREEGKIDEVIVLSWSDEEYPSKKLKKLPKAQKELAEKRNKSVEEYVKTMRSVDVDTYNMAERPNAISKLFNTTDSKLKNSLVAAGLPTTADPTHYASKASHSVILVKIK